MISTRVLICLLFSFKQTLTLAPLCNFGYSPCSPDSVDGECVESPGEQCYIDADQFIYCCIRDPDATTTGPTTTAAVTTTAPSQAVTTAPGTCQDVLSCCVKDYCSTYSSAMAQLCPLTCGICVPSTVPSSCFDLTTDCTKRANLCFNATYLNLMSKQCAFTCGYCGTCGDNHYSCKDWASTVNKKVGFCENTFYTLAQKRKYCAKTCGYCGQAAQVVTTAIPNKCTDPHPSCPTWTANGFCTSTFYTATQKKEYCARTCGLC